MELNEPRRVYTQRHLLRQQPARALTVLAIDTKASQSQTMSLQVRILKVHILDYRQGYLWNQKGSRFSNAG